ncbi:NADH dehydrogenase [ubiquinone] 1 beta subcomplex subunit 4 [Chelonus insularis]|uniref:NADH dehydrogenase [ubiquinone] 1 beta subcomplex subunit 4 n=1 Tax=Chelonus insularis TaxID=460826 RepID=UPI00158BF7A7|nr:NADH dehydrogenase [ubiquinone] 1 beta subcomplex subunit 4 [Chelonus insularis]
MAGRSAYDISPLQREILEHRHARRTVLRQKYLEQTMNPYRHALGTGGHVEDEAVNRFVAARATYTHFWKPKWNNFGFFMGSYILPVMFLYYVIKKDRDEREHEIRTGQVAYAARRNKII